jgi:hypothetical protein
LFSWRDPVLFLHAVADAPDGLHKMAGAAQLFTQPEYLDVNGPRGNEILIAADMVDDLLAGKDPAGLARKDMQNGEFSAGELDRLSLEEHFMPPRMNGDAMDENSIGCGFSPLLLVKVPAQNCLETRNKDLGAEWLGDIIIGADLQTGNDIVLLAPGSQHYYRNLARPFIFPDGTTDLQSIFSGQHKIQDNGINLFPVQHIQGIRAVIGTGGMHASLDEIVGDKLLNVGIVFNNKDIWPGHGYPDKIIVVLP